MDEIKLESIVQNFISIIPLFKKKLLHDNCKFDKGNLNHSHISSFKKRRTATYIRSRKETFYIYT